MSCEGNMLIRASGLGKFYPSARPRHLLRYLLPMQLHAQPGDFWALRGVNFQLNEGKVLGVLGRNGSGKSTLLQIVAGLLQPSEGTIEVHGKTAALLELGAGFNPDFTGRENVLLSGAIYGYSREEILSRFDAIAAFADIGTHIDHPVKTYSSGMFARLAFAVAIEVNPKILLVDEILSVGDVGFQARCYRRIEKLRDEGTSILFVSHDLNAVQMLCDEVLLLERGQMIVSGPPKDVTAHYLHLVTANSGAAGGASQTEEIAGAKVEITDIKLVDRDSIEISSPRVGDTCNVTCRLQFKAEVKQPVISMQVKTMHGVVVYDQNTLFLNQPVKPCAAGDALDVAFVFQLHVCPGPFRFGIGVAEASDGVPRPLSGIENLAFEVISDRPAYGLANLEAEINVAYLAK